MNFFRGGKRKDNHSHRWKLERSQKAAWIVSHFPSMPSAISPFSQTTPSSTRTQPPTQILGVPSLPAFLFRFNTASSHGLTFDEFVSTLPEPRPYTCAHQVDTHLGSKSTNNNAHTDTDTRNTCIIGGAKMRHIFRKNLKRSDPLSRPWKTIPKTDKQSKQSSQRVATQQATTMQNPYSTY